MLCIKSFISGITPGSSSSPGSKYGTPGSSSSPVVQQAITQDLDSKVILIISNF